MYVTLARAKQHLYIESEYTAEDQYITYLIEVATATVERHINRCLEDLEDSDHNIPAPLQHAILLYMADLYANREVNTYSTATPIQFNYDYLLSLYMNYGDTTSELFEDSIVDEIARHMVIDRNGYLVIDPAYRAHCDTMHGARGRAYRRVLKRMCEHTTIDSDGNVIVEADNIN